jgi:hypothetical protein
VIAIFFLGILGALWAAILERGEDPRFDDHLEYRS